MDATNAEIQDILDAQRRTHRIACHSVQLQGIRSTQGRRLYVQDVPGDIREDVKAAYLEWHKAEESTRVRKQGT